MGAVRGVNMNNSEMILVLDFGSQYNQLITRRIRELGVYSELHSHKLTAEAIKRMNPKGIILSGGPHSVYDENSFRCQECLNQKCLHHSENYFHHKHCAARRIK